MTRHRATASRRRALLLAAPVAVLALGVAAACGWVGGDRPTPGTSERGAPAVDPFDVAVPAAQPTGGAPAAPGPQPDHPGARTGREPRAVAVLHRWDARRAAAYASGSPARLRALYAADAGRADVRLLRDYRQRGFTVRGMRMQLLAVTVLAHRPGLWRLRVTDRLARATAVRDGRSAALPRDTASTRLLTLGRGPDGRWRVARVSVPAPR